MKGIVYTRVSSDEQVKGMSLDFQRQDCLAYAETNDIEVLRTFVEAGESAKFAARPELLKLLSYCKAHRRSLDALIVWKLDRLSRNQMDYYFLKRTLADLGIAIRSATEPSLSGVETLEAKIFETFSALQAEIDNTMRRDRSLRGMGAKIDAGIFPWKAPIGYQAAPGRTPGGQKHEPDVPDPVRFPLIRRLFNAVLKERVWEPTELTRRAARTGLRSQTGKQLCMQRVSDILGNRFYAGQIYHPWRKEHVPGNHVPMLSLAAFERVQAIREGRLDPRRGPRHADRPEFPLRRHVRCAHCMTPLTASWSRGRSRRYPYYHCPRRGCAYRGKTVPKAVLEAAYVEALRTVTPSPNRFALAIERLTEVYHDIGAIERSMAALRQDRTAKIEERRQQLLDLKLRDLLTDEEFIREKEKLAVELSAANESTMPETGSAELPSLEALIAQLTEKFSDPAEYWTRAVAPKRVRFQQIVFPEGIPFDLKLGIGTANTSPILAILSGKKTSKSDLVRPVLEFWNHLGPDYSF